MKSYVNFILFKGKQRNNSFGGDASGRKSSLICKEKERKI